MAASLASQKCVACMSKGEYVTAIFQAMAEQGLEHFEL